MHEDLVGRRFGRLTVLEQAPSQRVGGVMRRHWRCACACGAEHVVFTHSLTSGNTRSCGCLSREMATERTRLADQHRLLNGQSASSPTWCAWRSVATRATVPVTDEDGTAVQCAPRWLGLDGYAHFLEDLGERPSAEHHLTRIDEGAPYSKSNCAWRAPEGVA